MKNLFSLQFRKIREAIQNIPLSVIPLGLTLGVILLFVFYVPDGGDLISPQGDFELGQGLGVGLLISSIIDVGPYFRRRKS